MSDQLSDFKPFMLRGLTYGEALQQMRATGCAARRNHWCAPVLVYEGARLLLDNEEEVHPWDAGADDRHARDWETVKPHCRACGEEKAWRQMRWVCTCDYEAHLASLERAS